MMKVVSSLCAAVMALTMPLAAPAMAMPKPAPAVAEGGLVPLLVQDGQSGGIPEYDGRRYDRPRHYDGRRYDRYDRDEYRYWRGHRGYRQPRPGYRRHGDFWFPPAAFIAGAIIGGAIANQQPPIRYRPRGGAHEEWCYDRYRSYRAYDNTFQPYNGPRRQCRSPYG